MSSVESSEITDHKESTKEDIPMDERKRLLVEIIKIIRQKFREYFGLEFANQCGYFVDNYMCKDIRDFGYWLDYPTGNHTLEGKSIANCAAISSDGCYLFIGYNDKCIVKWNMITLDKIDEWTGHEKTPLVLIFRCGLLISGSEDRTVKVWNGYTNQLIHTLKGHTDWVKSVDLNRNGSEIISSSSDRSMRVWSVSTGECLREINVHSDNVRCVRFIGEFIISGSHDKSMKITNHANGKEIKSITEGITDKVVAVYINSDQSMVACLFLGGLTIYTWPEMKMIRSIVGDSTRGDFHPLNPDILAVNPLRNVVIYNVKTGECIRMLEGHTSFLYDIRYSPDGSRIVSTSYDKSIRVWDVSDM